MSENNIESILKTFGMTEYESRAYLTLLSLGNSTAEQISRQGKIPLPRVYDTLVELRRKGFVLISKSRPKKFLPIEIEKALGNYISDQEKKFNLKIEQMKSIIPEVKKSASSIPRGKIEDFKFDIWSFDRKSNIDRILDEQKTQAKKEVIIFSGDMSWMMKIPDLIRKIVKKGIKVRVIAHDPKGKPQFLKNIEEARKMGVTVRTGYTGIVKGHIVDDKIASISIIRSKEGINAPGEGFPGSEKDMYYEMMTFNNPVLISALRENFELWWERLK